MIDTAIVEGLSRDDLLAAARNDKVESEFLDLVAHRAGDDEEILLAVLNNPKALRMTVSAIAERAPLALLEKIAKDRVLLGRFPDLVASIKANPAVTDEVATKATTTAELAGRKGAERQKPLATTVKELTIGQKIALAKKGNKEARMLLIRDSNEMVALEVLSSPRITDTEVLAIAQMRDVSDKVLRAIANTRKFRADHQIVWSLLNNPKTPIGVSLGLGISALTDKELEWLSKNKNVPGALQRAAKHVLEQRRRPPAQSGGH